MPVVKKTSSKSGGSRAASGMKSGTKAFFRGMAFVAVTIVVIYVVRYGLLNTQLSAFEANGFKKV